MMLTLARDPRLAPEADLGAIPILRQHIFGPFGPNLPTLSS